MSWRTRCGIGNPILLATVVGAVVSLSPSVWIDVEGWRRVRADHLDDLVRPAAVRSTARPEAARIPRSVRDGRGRVSYRWDTRWRGVGSSNGSRCRDAVGSRAGDRRRHPGIGLRKNSPARNLRTRERATLPCRRPVLGLRPRGGKSARPAGPPQGGRVREARPGPLWPDRGGMHSRRAKPQRVDGRRGMGFRLPAILPRLLGEGVARTGGEARSQAG